MLFNIQKRRKELGLTLEEVGNMVGVSKSTVKKWENGHIKNMRRDKIQGLANALRVSCTDILSINEISYPSQTCHSIIAVPQVSEYTSLIKQIFKTSDTENVIVCSLSNKLLYHKLSEEALKSIINIIQAESKNATE